MYYRRKLILGLLEACGGKINSTRLQKLLLLVTRQQVKKAYDFVPYQFGCYSFTANQDMKTLGKYGIVAVTENSGQSTWLKLDNISYLNMLNKKDIEIIRKVSSQFNEYSNKELIKYTYRNYPFWAINSTIANELLNSDELSKIDDQKSQYDQPALLTIGYEGLTLESYINKLLINGVDVLWDVRKNSLSRKYGFSKNQLKHACEGVGIVFFHVPDLGIDSEKRQVLNSIKDYKKLFKEYEKTTLKKNLQQVRRLISAVSKGNRVAITCFEHDQCMCHRGEIAKKVQELDPTITVKHI
ncbi:MAG: DUF488 family protein [Crocinitomicaceae bacterium]|nr:DUF488 family protein [Crocinitomicaceae bacterium]